MSHCGFWLDSKCLEVLSRLGRKVRQLRLAARLFPERADRYCREMAELVRLAVEVEEMRERMPETARWNGELLALKPSRSVSPSVGLREIESRV